MVYCIGSAREGVCKIGTTKDVETRLMTLQIGCPISLDVLGILEGGAMLEASLHQKFAANRLNGEWFTLSKGIRTLFDVADVEEGGEEEEVNCTLLCHPIHPTLLTMRNLKDMHVLLALCDLAQFNKNYISLTGSKRLEVMAKAKVSNNQLSNSITRLKAAQLIAGGRGEATINPLAFWKGTYEGRGKAVRKFFASLPPDSQFDASEHKPLDLGNKS